MKANKIICSVMGIACAVSGWLTFSGFTTASASADEINPCSHEYEMQVVAPTCSSRGYTIYDCIKCGDTYSDNYVEANGHSYTDIVIEPTCTHRGYTSHYCTTCGYEYSDTYVEALGHDYVKDEKKPTCTESGETNYVCLNCNDVITEYHEAIGHSYNEVVTEATCISYGYTKHVCEACGDSYVTDYVKPFGHDYEVTRLVAEKDTLGYTKYQCKNCDYSYITDYVTSGDDGYLELPTEEEKPVVPDVEPDKGEEGEKPITPDGSEDTEEHAHEYVLFYGIDEIQKVIQFGYSCECGEVYSGELKALFVDNEGSAVIVPIENGMLNYSEMYGEFNIVVMDASGNNLTSFDLSNVEKVVEQPIAPDNSEEQEQIKPDDNTQDETKPNDTQEEVNSDNTQGENDEVEGDKTETDKPAQGKGKNNGLLLGIGIAMAVILAGLITTFIVMKKKKNKNKEN